MRSLNAFPPSGTVVAGKYRVDRIVGRGGMGAVFRATHVVTDKPVALKWLLPERADADATHRLVREAKAAARVRHDNVVDVYDVGEHDGSLFLVMEYLEGETLADRLRATPQLSVADALSILLPVMRGVAAAHHNQVIHRDLKPSNIFLCSDQTTGNVSPRVVDFGVSKLIDRADLADTSITAPGEVVGTPYYMAPEVLMGKARPDERADIYALGVILYQTLTGELPFRDANHNALVVLIATTPARMIGSFRKDLPVGLSEVVERALAKDPAQRFASVTQLIDALLPFSRTSRTRDSRPSLTPAVPPRWKRALWPVATLLLLLVVVALLLRSQTTSPPIASSPVTITPIRPVTPPTVARTAVTAVPPVTVEPAAEPSATTEPKAERRTHRRRSAANPPEPVHLSPNEF